jgi:predicted esterase
MVHFMSRRIAWVACAAVGTSAGIPACTARLPTNPQADSGTYYSNDSSMTGAASSTSSNGTVIVSVGGSSGNGGDSATSGGSGATSGAGLGGASGGLGGLGSNASGASFGPGSFLGGASSSFGGFGSGSSGFGGLGSPFGGASSSFGGFGSGSSGFGGPGSPFGGASSSDGGLGSSRASSGSSASSVGATSSAGASASATGASPTMLPAVTGTCPTLENGTVTISAGGGTIQAQVWAGSGTSSNGPLILYWHGTGSSAASEVPDAFDVNAVTSAGGAIVGFISNSRTGTTTGNTGDDVWYESDAAFADQVVACAIQELRIDPRRIHTAGYSAGALQTVYMWYARSGYIASAISYSGGIDGANQAPLQDPSNVPPVIVAHGAQGSDELVLDFAQASAQWESDIKTAGGFSIDCNDGGNHLAFFTTRAPKLKPAAVQFFLDHPFKVKPEPYTILPAALPSYCKID